MKLYFLSYFLFLFFLPCFLISKNSRFLTKVLEKIGLLQEIREEAPEKHKAKRNTPTAGGLIFLIILTLIWIPESYLKFQSTGDLESFSEVLLISLLSLFTGLIGFLDDYLKKTKKQNQGLKPREKIALQFLISLGLALVLQKSSTNFFGTQIELNYFFSLILVTCVLVSSMNAVNLTDGIDGLASSQMALIFFFAFWYFLYLAGFHSIPGICSACLILSGSCFGFYLINKNPAKVFMGDTGSFFLGGIVAILFLFHDKEWYLLIFLFIPVLETVSVILQVLSCKLSRKFLRKDLRIFKMTPLHHHFELLGWNEKKIVQNFFLLQFLVLVIFSALVFN